MFPSVVIRAVESRVVILLLGVVLSHVLRPYDTCDTLWDTPAAGVGGVVRGVLAVFSHWDSVFFLSIAARGYAHENAHAFFPLLPTATAAIASVLRIVLPEFLIDSHSLLMLSGFLFTNFCYVLSAYFLEKLTLSVFGKEKTDFAEKVVSVYLITPANVFMSAIYTESPFALFVFAGCYFLECRKYWVSMMMFTLSAATRGNGIICCGFLIFEAINRFFPIANKFYPSNEAKVKEILKHWIFTLLRMSIIVIPYIMVQRIGAKTFCQIYQKQNEINSSVSIPEFCSSKSFIPGHYGFIQSKYWNQGFMHYYQIKQIPNFILASPMAIISYSAVFLFFANYIRLHFPEIYSLLPRWLRELRCLRVCAETVYTATPGVLVYVGYWAFLLVVSTFFMHVQVMTRFLATTPALYWFMASLFNNNNAAKGGTAAQTTLSVRGPAYWVLVYCIVFTFAGVLLFGGFYPWT
eukprot:TRINITY_DN28210_c0_g1_i1.p1 TRINITY_DN28210_c0_g1~~TRINITY_DN28210_c0_g1_i1.p1  ORF type:complete len:464 (+),score=53.93 TRINITY_DN28210_c0_g1_i1:3-1394(+)